MELHEAIMNRRSIRRFTDHYVTNNEIKALMEAARFAPSWANTQVWDFIIVRDMEKIRMITETYSETNPARKCSSNSSAIIVVCAKNNVSGCKEGKQRTKFSEWFMFDLGLAVQNICLKAHEIGLGTVIVGSMDHEACKKILSVPDSHEVVAAIPLGKSAVEGKQPPPRKEIKDFVFLDTFNDPFIALGE